MKTLEEKALEYVREHFSGPEVKNGKPLPDMLVEFTKREINSVLQEAAEKAKVKREKYDIDDRIHAYRPIVDKESILSLKDKY